MWILLLLGGLDIEEQAFEAVLDRRRSPFIFTQEW